MPNKATSGLAAVMQSMAGRILFVLINAATGAVTARALHPSGRGELAALGVWPISGKRHDLRPAERADLLEPIRCEPEDNFRGPARR